MVGTWAGRDVTLGDCRPEVGAPPVRVSGLLGGWDLPGGKPRTMEGCLTC